MFESKSGVLLIAGLGFFGLAFVSNAVVPWVMYADQKEMTVKDMVDAPTGVNVLNQFQNLEDRYPDAFHRVYEVPPPLPKKVDYDPDVVPVLEKIEKNPKEELTEHEKTLLEKHKQQLKEHDEELNRRTEWFKEKCAIALYRGRDVYVGEACWHCHSQFVRPVSNEERRYGEVAKSWEFNNELQRPVMFGTRRVGPDLSREAGRRGNDWHYNHFFKPRRTSPESVMPDYPWFYGKPPVVLGVPTTNATGGVRVGPITPEMPAAESGIKEDDLILKLDNIEIDGTDRLSSIVATRNAGDKVTLTLERAGKTLEIKVKLVELDGPGELNERGFAIITYMQWLGSWLDSYPHYREGDVVYHRGQSGVKQP